MFSSKNLLVGLVVASALFGVGNWSVSIAQNHDKLSSTANRFDPQIKIKNNIDRFPTVQEVRQLAQEFEQKIIPSMRRSRQYGLGERSRELDSFVRAWSKVDPELAYFLGRWSVRVSEFIVYPSSTRGRACVVITSPSRPSDGPRLDAFFAVATISDGYLWMDVNVRNSVIRQALIRDGNYLGSVRIWEGKPHVSARSAFSDPLRAIESLPLANTAQNQRVIQQFSAAGCTASLPSQVRLNR
jgi:hypothetical protein